MVVGSLEGVITDNLEQCIKSPDVYLIVKVREGRFAIEDPTIEVIVNDKNFLGALLYRRLIAGGVEKELNILLDRYLRDEKIKSEQR